MGDNINIRQLSELRDHLHATSSKPQTLLVTVFLVGLIGDRLF